jgi:hypothetical protein
LEYRLNGPVLVSCLSSNVEAATHCLLARTTVLPAPERASEQRDKGNCRSRAGSAAAKKTLAPIPSAVCAVSARRSRPLLYEYSNSLRPTALRLVPCRARSTSAVCVSACVCVSASRGQSRPVFVVQSAVVVVVVVGGVVLQLNTEADFDGQGRAKKRR